MSFFRSKPKDLTKNNNNNDLSEHSSKSEDVTEYDNDREKLVEDGIDKDGPLAGGCGVAVDEEEEVHEEKENEVTVESVDSSDDDDLEVTTENTIQECVVQKEKRTITIEGTTYDITDFDHPGGNIINYASGNNDATDTFREFHYRSKTARRVLQSLPHVENEVNNDNNNNVSTDDSEIKADFREMRTTLVNNGCFEPDYTHVYFRLMEIAFYFGLGTFLASYNTYASLFSFILFKTRCGWVQHEAGHTSLTGIKSVDRVIQTITMGFGGGVSSSVWNSMHNKHHATPQKIKHDIDLDTTPAVAFFKTAFEKNTNGPKSAKYMNRIWTRLQAWSFLPLVNGVFVHLFWTYYLHPRKVLGLGISSATPSSQQRVNKYKKQLMNVKWLELICMTLSHTVIPGIFMAYSGYSIFTAYFLLMICNFWNFIYLFGHFSLSHTFTDVIPEDKHLLWFEYAIRHSVNISTKSSLVTWVMGYLNFQIEHHLFPSMPQYKNAVAAPYVRRFCEKWDSDKYHLKYTEMSYFKAWKMMFTNLNEVGKHYYDNGVTMVDDKKNN
jgi:fatty acid desaturase/cytochrome b involved in lipid metabolism